MKLKLKILILLLIPVLAFITPVFAFDISDFGDYNSRSMYLNYKQKPINQEKINLLKAKNLRLDVQCLNKQIKKNNIENVELLLDVGVDVNSNYMGETPLYIATKKNNLEIVKLLIQKKAKPDNSLYSELHEAIKNKNEEIAQVLLDNKAKIDYMTLVTNDSILYSALKNNMYSIAQQLIKKGATIDNKSAYLIKKKKLSF